MVKRRNGGRKSRSARCSAPPRSSLRRQLNDRSFLASLASMSSDIPLVHPLSLGTRMTRSVAKYGYLAGLYTWFGWQHSSRALLRAFGGSPLPLVRTRPFLSIHIPSIPIIRHISFLSNSTISCNTAPVSNMNVHECAATAADSGSLYASLLPRETHCRPISRTYRCLTVQLCYFGLGDR